MGAQGSTTVNFGAFPGSNDTSITIAGQTAISTASLVEAWLYPLATTDHSVAEHYIDPPVILAGEITAGSGFTIRGLVPAGEAWSYYGLYTVAWVWN